MGGESDSPAISVESLTHRALGPLVGLTAPGLSLRLTRQEAYTLALALRAVADGRSPEREIFMSPIASNGYFVGRVEAWGLAVEAGDSPLSMNWQAVARLANALASASPRDPDA